jgi:membrane-associated protease RseP (regulator of RpoE activity)
MRVRRPQVAIEALPLLRAHGVPYATVIVPWPAPSIDVMLDDLESTVAYADRHETHLVQVNLPGYSQHFAQEELFDLEAVWSAVVDRVRELRATTAAPIVVMPSMYEENRHEARKNQAVVMGVVRNSPAARAGLRQGDEIFTVNGLAVSSRPQARQVLAMLRDSGAERATLLVSRNGRGVDVTLNPGDHAYPYTPESDRHLGVVMLGTGLRPGCLEKLKTLIDRSGAKHVLFLSSALVRPSFEQALSESALFSGGGLRIDVEVPRNRFFGGNIFMGDLLVVQDFIDCIREYVARSGVSPDLVVTPSSPFNLGAWRRDLTGRVYLDIERAVGVPVELLDCETIYE